jgi:hypothetical protein
VPGELTQKPAGLASNKASLSLLLLLPWPIVGLPLLPRLHLPQRLFVMNCSSMIRGYIDGPWAG